MLERNDNEIKPTSCMWLHPASCIGQTAACVPHSRGLRRTARNQGRRPLRSSRAAPRHGDLVRLGALFRGFEDLAGIKCFGPAVGSPHRGPPMHGCVERQLCPQGRYCHLLLDEWSRRLPDRIGSKKRSRPGRTDVAPGAGKSTWVTAAFTSAARERLAWRDTVPKISTPAVTHCLTIGNTCLLTQRKE